MVLASTGPWLVKRGYARSERRRVVAWMALSAVLVGLLFAWALSHQRILGLRFPHASDVMTTNLIAGSLLGLVIGTYDVTSHRRRRAVEAERETVAQQRTRLSVLNRVLRHNLRNDLNAVTGYAELLEADTDDPDDHLARIRELATGLVSIGEKAREIEALLAPERAPRIVPVSTVVGETVESIQTATRGCTIQVGDLVDRPVDASVLQPVLGELLDNACRYNDADDPWAAVSAAAAGEGTAITVVDNGPGIPDHEIAPIREGSETALEHGSGLGLWLVEWGATAPGSEISFSRTDDGGTAARLWVPSPPPA